MRTTRLTPEGLARLLKCFGWEPATPAMVRDCLDDGAPQNPDGTIDAIPFLVWLLNERDRRDG